MAERRGGAGVLGRGPGQPARAAVRCRLVRRARQVAAGGSGLRHAAVRLAAGRAAAPARHHHAAADPAVETADRRSAHRGDARRDAGQCRASVAGIPRRGARALCRHAARPAGDRRRDHRGPAGRVVVARHDRGAPRRRGAAARTASWSGSIRRRRRGRARTPAASSRRDAARTAASTCWRTRRCAGLSPAGWASKAIALYRRLAGRRAGGGGQPGRRHGARGAARGRCHRCRSNACTRRAASMLRAEPIAAMYAAGHA